MPILGPKEVKQTCPKCKGSGTNGEVVKDRDNRVVLAPTYEKGEGNRPQYGNCEECNGEGLTLQPVPEIVMIDGEEQILTPEEARARYVVA